MTLKLVAAWIVGGFFMLAGIWIISNLQLTIGVPGTSYILALIVALGLILASGLLWISVAVATRHRD